MAKQRLNLTLDRESREILDKIKAEMDKSFPQRQTSISEIVERAIKRTYRNLKSIYADEVEYHQAMLLAYAELIKNKTAKETPEKPDTTSLQGLNQEQDIG